MTTTPHWLHATIHDLAAIDRDGRLGELVTDHALECRRRDLPLDDQLVQPDADFAAREIGRAAAQLFGVSAADAERIAREELRQHPRRDVALELLAAYRGHAAVEAPADAPKKRGRAW